NFAAPHLLIRALLLKRSQCVQASTNELAPAALARLARLPLETTEVLSAPRQFRRVEVLVSQGGVHEQGVLIHVVLPCLGGCGGVWSGSRTGCSSPSGPVKGR